MIAAGAAADGQLAGRADRDRLVYHLRCRPGHQRNFLDSVKSRQQPVASAEIGHRTASICHLSKIPMKLDRMLKWDQAKGQFAGDDEASRLLAPSMRSS